MTTVARPLTTTRPRESLGARLVEFTEKAPVHIALVLIAVIWLVPTVGLLVTSFRAASDIQQTGWWNAFVQWRFTPANYIEVLTATGTTIPMYQNLINSFIITIPATFIPVLVGALAAYAFAWLQFRGRDWIFLTIVALLIVPLQMTFVPVLLLYNDPLGPIRALFALVNINLPLPQFRLTSNYIGLWLAHSAYGLPFAIFLLRGFFAALPRDLFEAAKIDGSSELGIFWRIVLPLSVPALAALTIFQFLGVWNDLLVALVYAQSPNLQPLTVGVSSLLSTYGPEWDVLSAAAFITMFVPLMVFFSLQKYFVTGLTAGSVKS